MTSRPFPTDIQTIRTFIMYDALAERDPFDGYKTFCKVIGRPDYDYVEYEYWYYYFYHGNLDLHYDPRSLDTVQRKLDDLPNEILVGVVEHLDVKSRLITQKVSRKLRQLSHKTRQPVRIEDVGVTAYRDGIEAQIDGNELEYLYSHVKYRKEYANWKVFKYGGEWQKFEWLKFAISDFWSVLEIPKLEIGEFRFSQVSCNDKLKFIENLQRISEKSSSKFHVSCVATANEKPSTALKVLSLLEPGILKKISLSFDDSENPLNIDDIAGMEQFKQAKICYMKWTVNLQSVHLHHFYNFEEFQIRLESIQPAAVVVLRDALASSAHFKKCKIDLEEYLDVAEMRQVLGFEEDDEEDVIRKKQILSNPQEFLRIRISEDLIYISKESIESYRNRWPTDNSIYNDF